MAESYRGEWRDGSISNINTLRQHLPPTLARKVISVMRDGNQTRITFWPRSDQVRYQELTLDDPWLSDQMLARIALEAP